MKEIKEKQKQERKQRKQQIRKSDRQRRSRRDSWGKDAHRVSRRWKQLLCKQEWEWVKHFERKARPAESYQEPKRVKHQEIADANDDAAKSVPLTEYELLPPPPPPTSFSLRDTRLAHQALSFQSPMLSVEKCYCTCNRGCFATSWKVLLFILPSLEFPSLPSSKKLARRRSPVLQIAIGASLPRGLSLPHLRVGSAVVVRWCIVSGSSCSVDLISGLRISSNTLVERLSVGNRGLSRLDVMEGGGLFIGRIFTGGFPSGSREGFVKVTAWVDFML